MVWVLSRLHCPRNPGALEVREPEALCPFPLASTAVRRVISYEGVADSLAWVGLNAGENRRTSSL